MECTFLGEEEEQDGIRVDLPLSNICKNSAAGCEYKGRVEGVCGSKATCEDLIRMHAHFGSDERANESVTWECAFILARGSVFGCRTCRDIRSDINWFRLQVCWRSYSTQNDACSPSAQLTSGALSQ